MVFLGDGEFDVTALQATLNEAGWCYACRTAHRGDVGRRDLLPDTPGCVASQAPSLRYKR